MRQINEDISTGNLKQCYLLYGEEDYLKRQFRARIKDALLAEDDSMNLTVFEGKDADPASIIDRAETMPFFADRRVILVDDSGLFSGSGAQLADYLPEMPETTVIVFTEAAVDKRSRLYKAVKKTGYAAEFTAQDEKSLTAWVQGRMKREGKQVSAGTVQYLLENCGTDMFTLKNELEKLFSYTLGRDSVTRADIDAVCHTMINNRIFEMTEALGNGQRQRALRLYYDLLALKEAPMRILFLITRQFRMMQNVLHLKEDGTDDREISSLLGTPSWTIKKYLAGARALGAGAIAEALKLCADLELAVKTGNMNEQMSVELLLTQIGR